jgi:predicted SnoaL-like aldol condensation-catalyzing enzyme
MKQLFLLAIAAFFFAACNNQASSNNKMGDSTMANGQESKQERNKKVALASVEAINAHNVDEALKDAAADITDYGDGSMGVIKGKDSIKAAISQWLAAFPDVKGENLKAAADGDLVMVWGVWGGTFKKDFMGMKATGKSYKAPDVDIFTFNDEGKITEHHGVQSGATIMMQVGAKMPPQHK